MGFTPESQATFVVKNLGPTLEQNGFGDLKIMVLDDQRLFLPGWVSRMRDHEPLVDKYVSGIAVHWYMDSIIPPIMLDKTHDLFPDKFIFGTEACVGEGPQQHVIIGSFVRAEEYAQYILQVSN
jgi:glucosylceramidase